MRKVYLQAFSYVLVFSKTHLYTFWDQINWDF